MNFNSIKFKISVFYTALLGAILFLYTGLLYVELYYSLSHDLDRNLAVKAQEVSNAINAYMDILGNTPRSFSYASNRVIRLEGYHPSQDKVAQVDGQWLKRREELGLRKDYVTLTSIRGEAIVISPNIDSQLVSYFMRGLAGTPEKAVFYKNVDFGHYRLRVINIPYYYKNKRQYLIQVGESRAPIYSVLYGRLFFALIAIPVVLFFASFLGGMITRRILRPVVEVTRIARNITYKDLSVRVKTEHVEEEMRYLVDAFNEMISRLDKSFHYIAEFSSNVAHELKTPLTIIRGESELALMKEREPREYRRVIGLTLDETERLFRVIEDLLLLSRLEYQPEAFKFETIDFSGFIKEIYEQGRKLALKKGIYVWLDCPAHQIELYADRLHLRRLFLNLLSNAVKFTPAEGSITITVTADDSGIRVVVADTGVGIAPQDMHKIFNRFFHVDRSGPAGEGGTGLGLSIAQSIARIHHGEITVASAVGKGTSFTVALPKKIK